MTGLLQGQGSPDVPVIEQPSLITPSPATLAADGSTIPSSEEPQVSVGTVQRPLFGGQPHRRGVPIQEVFENYIESLPLGIVPETGSLARYLDNQNTARMSMQEREEIHELLNQWIHDHVYIYQSDSD